MNLIKAFSIITIFLTITIPSKEKKLLVNKNSHNFFIENKGQWAKEVKYLARIGGMNAWITDFGVVYDYYKIIRNFYANELSKTPLYEKEKFEREHTSIKGHIIKATFRNRSYNQSYITQGKKETYYNYFIGNDKSKWAKFIPLYEEVTLKEIYSGIDIKYYIDKNLLRYDFIVKPGADISQINIEFEGTKDLIVTDKGELEIETSLGKVKHQNIVAYQDNKTVECSFIKRNNNSIGFIVEDYDKNKEMIIDPLVYSTFLGGSASDFGYSLAVDVNGNVYVAGSTGSSDYPTTTGAYDESYNVQDDVFISKLNSDGSSLIYSTFIGGNGGDIGNSIKLDKNGNSFVAGWTTSTDFPTTSGAYDESHNGSVDVIVLKLNAAGTGLIYSTLIGGSGGDGAQSLTIDESGNAFITGLTLSTNYPTTNGAYDQSYNGGQDVFFTKLNSMGTSLIYSTFIGGSLDDVGYSIAIDVNGNAYVTGWTYSNNFPTTSSAYDKNHNGISDVFLTKINTNGAALIYSTFIGGSDNDTGLSLAVDVNGNVFVTGHTSSINYPTTIGAYDETYNGLQDIFITKIKPDDNNLIYSTYIGGNSSEAGLFLAINLNGDAFITGNSLSTNFPTTIDAYSRTNNGGPDVILTIINSSGSSLTYSTNIGGTSSDRGYSVVVDNRNNVFITGNVITNTFKNYPTTSGAYDENPNGLKEAFVTKFSNLVTSVDDENNTNILPKNMTLEQNYPNPFNPETAISYQLSAFSKVSLKVYDVLGREIATLVNEEKPAGSYKVNFNASGLTSGIYFYRLKTSNFVDIKKMVFIK